VLKRPKKHSKPIRIRFKQNNKIHTIAFLSYSVLINQSPPIFIYGHVVVRTLQRSSTDGMIGGLSTIREIPFHLDRNELETTVVGSNIQVNVSMDIPNRNLRARWRSGGVGDPWSAGSDLIRW